VRAARLSLVSALLLASCDACDAPPRTDIPELRVPRASGAITLDGRLDEAAWASAPRTERFVATMDGSSAEPEVTARMLRDDARLYVAFEVDDPLLVCGMEGDDAHLWEADAVELMIDPDGDGLRYFELQVSPSRLVFDTRFDSPRQPAPFGHLAWQSGLVAGVDARGTVDDEAPDDGYTVELAIPWAPLGMSSPPGGETWRVALYVLDARSEGQLGVGWSPPLVGDFHVPDRFGRVAFE
jgi:hypothetical protein